ncbi:hypothetical protein FACS1894187_16300 [Synergistales bacterium]|nr:hypothetical protein FACS1894187_16300 [Synergistales bacterium]
MSRRARIFFGFGVVLLAVLYNVIMYPPAWLVGRLTLRSTVKITSAAGGFSLDVPTRWKGNSPGLSHFPAALVRPKISAGKEYLNTGDSSFHETKPLRGGINSRRSSGFYARMSVYMETLPVGDVPFARELADVQAESLVAGLGAAREGKARTEVQRLKGYPWGKTTVTTQRVEEAIVCWQTVDDNSNHYTIVFSTNAYSSFKPVFDKIMKSFTSHPPVI